MELFLIVGSLVVLSVGVPCYIIGAAIVHGYLKKTYGKIRPADWLITIFWGPAVVVTLIAALVSIRHGNWTHPS